ncbi:MAG TPA: glycosyltransferase family 2 protein, partial [Candidatus Egerieimonas intestinavium]|nr:glycosyltransferase family 2 protein [Candidatus Egerieimonas intestinavium]
WGRYRSIWKIQGEPLVSIVIPNKDHLSDLKRCLDSIYRKSTYRNFEVLVLENNSTSQEIFRFYEELENTYENLKVLRWEKGFNYAAINNFGAEQAKGEYLLFLNNDTEVITPDWLEELLGYCQREDVGAVGAKLYYPNDTIQHAGIVLGMGADGVAGHILYGTERGRFTYAGRANSTQDISAVTAACMMVKKEIHQKIEGFDSGFAVAFNDVDYCLRIRELGKLVVFDAFVELYHYESNSRGKEDTREKQKRLKQEAERFHRRWKSILEKGDPYYNPNLSLLLCDCSLRWPRRINL